MRGAHVARSETIPSAHVAEVGQASEKPAPVGSVREAFRVCRVLHEEELGFHKPKGLEDDFGEVAAIIRSKHFAGAGEWLTGRASEDHLSHAAIARGEPKIVECSEIAEDGSAVEDSVLDALGDAALGVVCDFDIAESFPSEQVLGSVVEAAGARADRERVHGRIVLALCFWSQADVNPS